MDIFKTPRDAAFAAQRNPVLWPGTDERFTGYGVMGLPFRSGHYLAMRHIPASSIGPEYRTVWHYAPDAVQEFIDELKAREEQPDEDSFCIWCHHRDEQEARKFIRDALKTTLPPM
jgi:hypothetical protein